MNYTIKPHSTAARLSVLSEAGNYECLYMCSGSIVCRPENAGINAYSTIHFYALPEQVRKHITAHYAECFSIPNTGTIPGNTLRGQWVDAQKPVTLEVYK